jgi:DNA gyrase subunit B
VYIAQPPLYKLKSGKQERYVKDDEELNNHLLQLALEGARLITAAEAPPIKGEGLANLVRQYTHVQSDIKRLSRRYDESVLASLVHVPKLDVRATPNSEQLQSWAESLQSELGNQADATAAFTVVVESAVPLVLRTERRVHGVPHSTEWREDFFLSAEYQRLCKLGEGITDLLEAGSRICRGDREEEVGSFAEAYDWLIKEAKRGLGIQRYKGLGEMNPEQLWETTMDPDTRRLLQVRIEDGVAADQIFTTLMGDHVEPRREFIESNALLVSNLDI